jgi:hypothetical protein
MPKTTHASVQPPAEAVAKDAHWSATRERLRNRHRPTARMTICDDHTVRQALDEARQVQRRTKLQHEADPSNEILQVALEGADERLAAAQQAFDEVAIVLRFQALERPAFEALKRAHPPTEEQAEEGQFVNIEAIAPHLIAASSLDGITVEDAQYYLDTWGESEAAQLFQTAWDVQGIVRADVGKG